MARRKFYRDEENPFDLVEAAPLLPVSPAVFKDQQKMPEKISPKPSGDIIQNLDEVSRRVNTGESSSYNAAILVYRSYTVANLPLPLTSVGFNSPSANE